MILIVLKNAIDWKSKFSLLFRTCNSEKRTFLDSKFPTLCRNIERVSHSVEIYLRQKLCEDLKWEPRKWVVDMINVRNLEEDIFLYAKKNLAVVNVYIKDPVVTRIMKDQVCVTCPSSFDF